MEPILQVQNLTHTYSAGTPFEHKALDAMNFSVERGEFVGVIGHTGSGKSTTEKQICQELVNITFVKSNKNKNFDFYLLIIFYINAIIL